nr:capsid protein [Totiviridae sp.]
MEKALGPVTASQSIVALCPNDYESPPGINEFRKYTGSVLLKWHAFGRKKINQKRITYEIGFRWDQENPARTKRSVSLAKKAIASLVGENPLARAPLYTPADYKEKLLKAEPKHTQQLNWETFDFSGPVAMLYAWLSVASWMPEVKLSQLVDTSKIRLVGLANLEDSAALAVNSVYIGQTVCVISGGGAYWALVAACAACGATVATDRAVLAGADTPRFMSSSGPRLWRDLLDAIRVLAELYDRSGGGEIFGYAMAKGLHTVNTVVGHSDEGGLIRDVLRECTFLPPYGGLPGNCPLSACMPTIAMGSPYSTLASIVDSLCLMSAAAVAQCAPTVVTDSLAHRPVVIQGKLSPLALEGPAPPAPNDPADKQRYDNELAQAKAEIEEHLDMIREPILDSMSQFSDLYLPGLARILQLASNPDYRRGFGNWMQQAAESVLGCSDNRHLIKNETLAPYFWVEPTTIFPSKWGNAPAETAGWASWGGPDEVRTVRMFDEMEQADIPTYHVRFYYLRFEGARKCPWIACLHNHRDDGLAQIHLKRLDPEALACMGGTAARLGPNEAFERRTHIADYLWVRGQSMLVHPAELLHMNDYLIIGLKHYKPEDENWLAAIPNPNEIVNATVTMEFQAPAGRAAGPLGAETRRERSYRTRGQQALADLVAKLRVDVPETAADGGYIKSAVLPRHTPQGRAVHGMEPSDAESAQRRQHPSLAETRRAAASLPSTTEPRTAARVMPTMVVGAHTGPRLPQAAPGGGAGGHTDSGDSSSGDSYATAIGGTSDGHGATGTVPAAP